MKNIKKKKKSIKRQKDKGNKQRQSHRNEMK
jgi:hypothetical protein